VLEARWAEFDFNTLLWTIPAERMRAGQAHRAPLTPDILAILEPMKAMASEYVFEGQKRHRPLSNMLMLMLMRRMGKGDFTVHRFRSTFRDWASEAAGAPHAVAEVVLAHHVGSVRRGQHPVEDVHRRRLRLPQSARSLSDG